MTALEQWLHGQLPAADQVRVEGLDTVDFGHSAEMMVFTIVATTAGEEFRRDVVLRLRPTPPALLEPYDLTRQFMIMSALSNTAVPVPPVLWLEDTAGVLGREFLVMARVAGEVFEMTAPDGPDVTPRRIRRMCESMAEHLAAIHSVDLSATGLEALGVGADHLKTELAHWEAEMHRVQRGALPALERLLRGLRESVPAPSTRVTLVHGDAKPGNFAFVGDTVSAVFDWELTTVGDPLTDLGWMELMWMQPVGLTSHPAACSFEEFVARYTEHSGIRPANRQWYLGFNAFKMAVICLIGSMLYDAGDSDDPRFMLNASGIPLLTQLGLGALGIEDRPDDGPVQPRDRTEMT
ncbi:hypothetical protein BH10ACT9_BH10ACT9_21110 [soil metagenome]